MTRYGRKNCKHEMRYRKNGWEEGCVPAICKKCGAFGCACDSDTDKELFFKEALKSSDDINNKWVNPYIRR